MSSLPNQKHVDKRRGSGKNSSKVGCCQICGDKAYIINYGALSCPSCKTFFRRNCSRFKIVHQCRFYSSCIINMKTRQKCTGCRLAKCLFMGMSSDFIRKDCHESKMRRSIPKSIKRCTLLKHKTFVPQFEEFHQFVLVKSEQRILSNIIYAIDLYSALSQVHHIIDDFSPSSHNIHSNMIKVLKTIILSHISMRTFINSIPDFRILTVNEQCSLVERNLNGIAILYSVLIFRDTNAIENYYYLKSLTSIYGLNITQQLIRINKQLDTDSNIVKLMLIVLAFSSSCSIVDIQHDERNDALLYGTHRLMGSQNVYIELLWKYLVSQYGYHVSVLRFARLIKIFLDLINYFADISMNNKIYYNLIYDFIEKTKQLLLINQHEQALLWGKI